MKNINVFGQPINDAEREKNGATFNNFVKKVAEKNGAQKTINECSRSISSCESQIKEKRGVFKNHDEEFKKTAQEVSEKAFKKIREKNSEKGLPLLCRLFTILVVITAVLSLVKLFPIIKDNMDITVILLLVGAPIVLIFLMCVSACAGSDGGKKESDKKENEFGSGSVLIVMVVIMILIAAFSCFFVYSTYGKDCLTIALPPYIIALVGAILMSGMHYSRLTSKKISSEEQKAKDDAYNTEFNKLKAEQKQKENDASLEIASLNNKISELKDKKEKAEKEFNKLCVEINDFDEIPDFYKQEVYLGKIAGYFTLGLADTMQSAFVLFEQYRRAELLSDLKSSEEEKKEADEKKDMYNKYMDKRGYEDWESEQEYKAIRAKIGFNVSKANDLIDEADSARRARERG